MDPTRADDVGAALDAFDQAFAAGDAETLSGMFASDATLLLLHGEPIEGRDAIRAHWLRVFGAWDTSAWRATRLVVDVHGDRAYAASTYTETLVERGGPATIDVAGRLVHFLHREPAGTWRVTLAMNSTAGRWSVATARPDLGRFLTIPGTGPERLRQMHEWSPGSDRACI